MDNADSSLNLRTIVPSPAIWAKRPHYNVDDLGLLRQRCAGAKAMHCVIDAARCRRLNDPAYRAIAAAVAIFGGLDKDVSFVFCGALFDCFGSGAQHDVWKSSVTDFVGMGYLYEHPRQHEQARSSHVLLSSFSRNPRATTPAA